MSQALTRRERLRRRLEFLTVQHRGTRVRGRYLTLFTRPNGLAQNRLGIIATRKVGGAVRRNRAKRVMRELFRRRKGTPGFDIVALLRPKFPDIPYSLLEADYQGTLQRHAHSNRD